MTEPLSADRFRALADAYGGVVARWPERERGAAMRFATRPEAAPILSDALRLDAALDRWRVPESAPALHDRIVRAAPGAPSAITRRARLWWSGIGLAAALAGAAAGVATVAIAAPVDIVADGTSFGDVGGQDG